MAKKNNKKRNLWLTILLLCAIIAMGTYAYISSKNKPKGTAVTFEKVEKRTILETVSASGKIFPEKEVNISSDVSGEIVELYVSEGDSVVVGELLAKIDPDAYQSTVERGQAAVASAKANHSQSKSMIESSRAAKEQIVAQLDNAKKIYTRNKKLFDDGVISEVEFEQAESSMQTLEANLRAAQANINSAMESSKGAEFNVKSAEASLKELNTNLRRTIIRAPVSGIISNLPVEQGERVVGTIQMTGTEMMRIANLNIMEVQVDVSENDIIRVSLGDTVNIEVDAYLDKIFKGTVTEIANSASNSSGVASLNTDQVTNFVVKVRMDPSSYASEISTGNQYPFRPGMSASVDIFTNAKEDVLTIPIQSVTTREDTTNNQKDVFDEVVFVHSADTVKMIKVKTGIQDDEYIEVLNGLDEAEEIVSGPYSAISKKLEDGKEVRLKEEKKDEDKKD